MGFKLLDASEEGKVEELIERLRQNCWALVHGSVFKHLPYREEDRS